MSVGMRSGSTLSYFLTDHLGSIVGVTDATGAITPETRYLPFGEIRADVGTISETQYGYTDQEGLPGLTLLDYNARMYDPYLNRWTQPDTFIGNPFSSQGYNRYIYSNNNSINYSDPSGNTPRNCGPDGENCPEYQRKPNSYTEIQEKILDEYGIYLDSGGWTLDEGEYIYAALSQMEVGVDNLTDGSGKAWILKNLSGAHISVGFDKDSYKNKLAFGTMPGIGNNPHGIENTVFLPSGFMNSSWLTPGYRADTMIVHELGHIIDNRSSPLGLGSILGGGAGDALMNFVGGSSTNFFGIRCKEDSLYINQLGNKFQGGDDYTYGNNSPADYFAQSFSATIMTPNSQYIPLLAKVFMSVYIDLTK